MYRGADRLQHGDESEHRSPGFSSRSEQRASVRVLRSSWDIAVLATIARPPSLLALPQIPQLIMDTLDTPSALSPSLISPLVPASERRDITPSILVFAGGSRNQTTAVNTVASPLRLKALDCACALLDAG